VSFLFTGIYFFIFFLSDESTEQTPGRILTRNGSKDAELCKDVPLGLNENLEFDPNLPPKPYKIWPRIGNFQPK